MQFRLFSLLVLVYVSFLTQKTYGQEVSTNRSAVIENYKGKPCYMHFVKRGETLSLLSKIYNISIDEIIAENPAVDKGLKADMVLRIPQKSAVEIPEAIISKTNKPKVEAIKVESPKTETQYVDKPQEFVKPADDPGFITYQLKKQETLYAISKQYNVTVDEILDSNPQIESVKEGMWIKIPKKKPVAKTENTEMQVGKTKKPDPNPDEIIVKYGETLYGISKEYNISVDELIGLNPKLSDGLKAGMILKLHKQTATVESKNPEKNDVLPAIQVAQHETCYNAKNIKQTYKVALLLPFLLDESVDAIEATEQKSTADFENFNYFQFYAGFMLAADSLRQYGLHAQIQVLDGDKLNDSLTIKQTLRKPGLDKVNLIVGPMYANSFAVAARFAMKNQIPIFNPLSRRENIVEGNPYVLKSQVSGMGIASKLSGFISSKYPDANVISIRNDAKELKTAADEFESQMKKRIADQTFKGSLLASNYSTDMIGGVAKKLKPGAKNILIYFSNNKTNVPNFVSLINPMSKLNDIILIGMDGWEEMELETEFLINLNFHQLTSSYIDFDGEDVQRFVSGFRSKYGAVPVASKHAFLGFDAGWYLLTSLMWNGDKFLQCVPGQKGSGLQYNFSFSTSDKSDGLQNQNINIVKLQDYKMVKVD